MFTKGQVIVGKNGRSFVGTGNDPLVMLGEAIGEAEAKDGKVTFEI